MEGTSNCQEQPNDHYEDIDNGHYDDILEPQISIENKSTRAKDYKLTHCQAYLHRKTSEM